MSKPNIYPSLYYRDANAAIEWLNRVFGFTTLLNVPGENGTVAHAELQLGSGAIMLGSAGNAPGTKSPLDLGGVTGGICVVVDGVRAHYERAKAAGVEITNEYEEKDYGGSGYGCRDLEGHEWSFGSYIPELR